jgi:hypothetical protein
MSDPRPTRVLIITMQKWWLGVARLPMALRRAGFEVAAWCPNESFVAKSGGISRHYPWETEANWHRELLRIVADWEPRLVIPADETIVRFLRKLARGKGGFNHQDRRLRRLLCESLGDPERSRALDGKIQLQELARSLGLRTPDDRRCRSVDAAVGIAGSLGWPVVLKDEFAAGGRGVAICSDEVSLRTAWSQLDGLRRKPSLKARVRRWVKDPFGGTAPRRSVQRFIQGRPAFHAMVAWQGCRLGGISSVVEVANPPMTGPSCVVMLKDIPEINAACEKLVSETGMSGFAGFDFMIEEGTGHAYLLECNPRPTPVSHLEAPIGGNLCKLLHSAMSGSPKTEFVALPERLLVLFPQEILRDPHSPYLSRGWVDFPTEEAPLLEAYKSQYPGLSEAMAVNRDYLSGGLAQCLPDQT